MPEIHQERTQLLAQARAIHTRAESENRPLSTEEHEQHVRLLDDIKNLSRSIQAANDLVALEQAHEGDEERSEILAALQGRVTSPSNEPDSDQHPQSSGRQTPDWLPELLDDSGLTGQARRRTSRRVVAALANYNEQLGSDEYLRAFRSSLVANVRPSEIMALNQETDSGGHYLMPPPRMLAEFLTEADASIFMRQLSRMWPMQTLQEIGSPYRKKRIGAPRPVRPRGKGAQGSLEIGVRKLKPTMTKLSTQIETVMLSESVIPADQLVREQLNLEFSESSEQEYMTGNGADEPLGIFVPSPNGISISRDFSLYNTPDALTFEALRHAKNRVPEKHRQKGTWVGHTDVLEHVANKKNGNGDFIWKESVVEGEPDKLMGRPVRLCDFAPNAFAPGSYVLVFGDFFYYWIAEWKGLQIQVLHEKYSDTNETGFVGRLWRDAMPMKDDAFARVKLADV